MDDLLNKYLDMAIMRDGKLTLPITHDLVVISSFYIPWFTNNTNDTNPFKRITEEMDAIFGIGRKAAKKVITSYLKSKFPNDNNYIFYAENAIFKISKRLEILMIDGNTHQCVFLHNRKRLITKVLVTNGPIINIQYDQLNRVVSIDNGGYWVEFFYAGTSTRPLGSNLLVK